MQNQISLSAFTPECNEIPSLHEVHRVNIKGNKYNNKYSNEYKTPEWCKDCHAIEELKEI